MQPMPREAVVRDRVFLEEVVRYLQLVENDHEPYA